MKTTSAVTFGLERVRVGTIKTFVCSDDDSVINRKRDWRDYLVFLEFMLRADPLRDIAGIMGHIEAHWGTLGHKKGKNT